MCYGDGEIAQWLVSLSVKPAVEVRARHDLLVSDGIQGAIDLFPPMLMTGSTKAIRVLSCVCDNVIRVGHRVPLAGVCLSLYGLHVLNRDVNMIETNKTKIYVL